VRTLQIKTGVRPNLLLFAAGDEEPAETVRCVVNAFDEPIGKMAAFCFVLLACGPPFTRPGRSKEVPPLTSIDSTPFRRFNTCSVASWTTESILEFLQESIPPASAAGKEKASKKKEEKGAAHEEL
jgi:hypothetical protein